MKIFDNYINGGSVDAKTYLDVYEPASGMIYGQVASSTDDHLELAIKAARNALKRWADYPIQDRSQVLHRIADLIDDNLVLLAEAETEDTGKPISTSLSVDIPRAAANFRFFANAIANFHTEAHLQEGLAVNYTRRKALGIVGCISPWNLPLYLFTWKIAPALAMGNCVIGKPSELTPQTATLLGQITREAGLPDGVLSILHGQGVGIGQAMVDHPEIHAISFTGGTKTGQLIAKSAANRLKKVSLELGGKNPVVVFDDADLNEAAQEVARSAFSNQGQICLCGSRILIQESIYEKFKMLLLKEIEKIQPGNPYNKNTNFGALITADHLDKVQRFVTQAISQGGKLLTGGHKAQVAGLEGYFYQPTVLEGLGPNCTINQEEVFGPVITLQPFLNEEEALQLANDVKYGLAASLWTKDVKRAHRISHQLESGIVWVNCWMHRDLRTPFGGVKMSGIGREGGNDAMRFFTEPQNICIKL